MPGAILLIQINSLAMRMGPYGNADVGALTGWRIRDEEQKK
jgi:hypothetical protein